jgi:DNA-binding transcriptional MerR regulator
MTADSNRRGELAGAAGVNVQTLRYYERRSLLDPPRRSLGGHRLYPPDTVALLGVIKATQRLGFTLDEIAELLQDHAAEVAGGPPVESGKDGPVPEGNRPGHHPAREQDKPDLGDGRDRDRTAERDDGREGSAPMSQNDQDQPKPGYRPVMLDPTDLLKCQRCGALVADGDSDLHDRFHVSIERPATMPTTSTRS